MWRRFMIWSKCTALMLWTMKEFLAWCGLQNKETKRWLICLSRMALTRKYLNFAIFPQLFDTYNKIHTNLCSYDRMHRDKNQRTALHLATLKGKPGVVGKFTAALCFCLCLDHSISFRLICRVFDSKWHQCQCYRRCRVKCIAPSRRVG